MLRITREDLGIFARGVLMGAADVVPGISGGTIALIVGIYPRLILALGAFDGELLRLAVRRDFAGAARRVDLRFLAALGSGIALAILTLAKAVTWLILNKPVTTWSLFFGLILGSTVLVIGLVGRWNASRVLAAGAGAALAYWICGLLPGETGGGLLALFASAMIAISAMILPGISGAFVLVLLGKYRLVLEALHQRDFVVIAVFCAGCAIGLIAFTKLLRALLARWEGATMAFLCGLMAGSLRKIWPFKMDAAGQELLEAKRRIQLNFVPDALDATALWALALAVAGVLLVIGIEKLGRRPRESQ
ncbi:MAG: DUF368 domain-containing protein [Elusimicrobiota bacterium]|nr:DUF368 domain-containing protein [Elusimicrobiota bacterium]